MGTPLRTGSGERRGADIAASLTLALVASAALVSAWFLP